MIVGAHYGKNLFVPFSLMYGNNNKNPLHTFVQTSKEFR